MKTLLLWLVAVLLLLCSVKSPQGMVFGLSIMIWLLRRPLRRLVAVVPVPVAFVGVGTAIGLLWEFLAILQNRDLPDAQKALLHPNPAVDLVMATIYYALFAFVWYLILRRVAMSLTAVFLIGAFFGLVVEQSGRILFGIFASPVIGTLLALLVMCVYATIPWLTYVVTEPSLGPRTPPRVVHYFWAVLSFVGFWAIYGNLVYQTFIAAFPK